MVWQTFAGREILKLEIPKIVIFQEIKVPDNTPVLQYPQKDCNLRHAIGGVHDWDAGVMSHPGQPLAATGETDAMNPATWNQQHTGENSHHMTPSDPDTLTCTYQPNATQIRPGKT